MPIQFACDVCGQVYSVKDHMAGRVGKCPGCGSRMEVPDFRPAAVEVVPARAQPRARPSAPHFSPAGNVQVVVHQDPGGKSANGLGVAAVVLGILAFLVCWIPLVNLMVVPLAFIGGLFAVIGLFVALVNKRSGPGWPLAGVFINVLAFAVMVTVNATLAGAIGSSVNAARDAARKAEANADARNKAPAPIAPPVEPAAVEPTPTGPADPLPRARAGSFDAPARESPRFPGGSRVNLARPGGAGHALVSIDREAFEQNLSAGFATFRRLSDEGRVLRIMNGTSAEVIEDAGASCKVRMLDGYKAGSEGWVESRYMELAAGSRREPPAPARKATAPKATPDRSTVLLQMGRNFEADGRGTPALEYYRKVVAEFPDTSAATEAGARIKALTGG